MKRPCSASPIFSIEHLHETKTHVYLPFSFSFVHMQVLARKHVSCLPLLSAHYAGQLGNICTQYRTSMSPANIDPFVNCWVRISSHEARTSPQSGRSISRYLDISSHIYLDDCIDLAITNTRSISMAIFKPAMDKTLPTLHGNCILLKAHAPAPKSLH
jgi:hypothetical protein